MQRRDFIRLGLAAGAGLTLPVAVTAASATTLPAGADIYFTKDAPGRWAGKAQTHLPHIEIGRNAGSVKLTITTAHEMKGHEHYIVKHVLLDKDLKFIAEHLFDPVKESIPVSTFTLQNYTGPVYALSMCNKHDVWVEMAEI